MSYTLEHREEPNLLHLVTDSTVTKLDYEDVGDLIMELTQMYDAMEELEIQRDKERS